MLLGVVGKTGLAALILRRSRVDRLLHKDFQANRITIASFAGKHSIEENTVARFLAKIDARIPSIEKHDHLSAFERVTLYISGWDLNKFLGFLMIPLDETWRRGGNEKGWQMVLH